MYDTIIVDGIVLPPPAKDGISYAPEAIWSENAGRTASCEFVGDIRAVKITISISWNRLTYEKVKLIRQAFTHIGKPFFDLTFTDDSGERQTISCYSTIPASSIRTYSDPDGNIMGMTVDVVQR